MIQIERKVVKLITLSIHQFLTLFQAAHEAQISSQYQNMSLPPSLVQVRKLTQTFIA